MNKLKHRHVSDFTIISNIIFRDRRLSFQAQGLLCQLISLPENWDFSIKGLEALKTNGVRSIKSALRELIELGYVVWDTFRNALGQFETNVNIFINEPGDVLPPGKKAYNKEKKNKELKLNNINIIKQKNDRFIKKDLQSEEIEKKQKLKLNDIDPYELMDFVKNESDSLKRVPLNEAQIKFELDSAIDWTSTKGRRHKDALAFFRNWLRKKITSQPHMINTGFPIPEQKTTNSSLKESQTNDSEPGSEISQMSDEEFHRIWESPSPNYAQISKRNASRNDLEASRSPKSINDILGR